ncbi:MAG: acyltransferase [Burkholderiales bacterium]|nr:acyltransferase [Burkholderiales bacterium]
MTQTTSRNPQIDLLRGIAILLVLLLHFTLAFGLANSPLGDLLGKPWLGRIALNGNYGVTMFFVISGYLITARSIDRFGQLEAIDLRAFFAFRFARILPSLVLALAIIVTLGSFGIRFFSNTDGGHTLPASFFVLAAGSVLTFWHNVLMAQVGWFNYAMNVYWSLSVEEVFYLAFPLACVFLRRRSLLVLLALGLMIAGPLYRHAHADDELYFECAYLACFDAIAMGCLVAMLVAKWQPQRYLGIALRVVGGVGLIITYLMGIHGHETLGFSAIAVCTAMLLLASGQASGKGVRWLAPLRWLGHHSYELYLFHIIILAGLRNLTDRDHLSHAMRLPWLALFIALSAALAWLVARYIGDPANHALRRRWARRGPIESVPPAQTASQG